MKVAVSAQENHLDSPTDPRFGRARYFLIVDTDSLDYDVISNPNVNAVGGAGIQSAQLVIKQGVVSVITGNCGPNAYRVLRAADIDVYEWAEGSVKEIIQAYKNGQLTRSLTDERGRGMGRGRGRARGQYGYQGEMDWRGQNPPQPISPPDDIQKEEGIRILKEEIQVLEERLRDLNQKLTQIEKDKKKSRSE
jgi:predicted Fe-Mo cluster-binding NifX family protein